MPFIRLSDNYIDHPKILALSDRAFRLWHEGIAFCRKHQTDGLIPTNVLEGFRTYQARAVTELTTPWMPGAQPLWHPEEPVGYRIHDYLGWNFSKEESELDRKETRERVRQYRERQRNTVTGGVTNGPSNAVVPSTDTDTEILEEKDRDLRLVPQVAQKPAQPVTARSKWPIFKGQRLTVFDFQLDDLQQMLGTHTGDFNFDEWFYAVDARAVASTAVIPKRDGGAWLQAQLLEEVRRRGWPIAGEKHAEDPYAHFSKAWLCNTCGNVHEGTREQAKQARCTRAES